MIDRTLDFNVLARRPNAEVQAKRLPSNQSLPNYSLSSFDSTVATIRSRLVKCQELYLDVASLYANFSSSGLTDDKRDLVDKVLTDALTECEDLIKSLDQFKPLDGYASPLFYKAENSSNS